MSSATISQFPIPDIPSNPSLIMGQFDAAGKNGIHETFKFRPVAQIDVRDIVALVAKVRTNLSDAQKHFLKDKDASQLAAHLQNNFPAVAIFKESKLVGFAMVSPQNDNNGAANLPNQFNKGDYISIGTVAVDPDLSGFGLGQKLVELAFKNAVAYTRLNNLTGSTAVIAKVATENMGSQSAFGKNGFKPVLSRDGAASYADPNGYNFNVWSKPIPARDEKPAPINGEREERWAQNNLPTRHHH